MNVNDRMNEQIYMKIAIQYTMYFYCATTVNVYDCIPGVGLICMVKIHKIITCSLGVSKC